MTKKKEYQGFGRMTVADNLRMTARSDMGSDTVIRSLKVCLGLDLGRHVGWRQVYERLADLIDPTCPDATEIEAKEDVHGR